MTDLKCRICGNAGGNVPYTVAERKIGLGDTFSYFQCRNCDCLQILTIPENMSRYYPPDFNSFTIKPDVLYGNVFLRLFLNMRDRYAVFNKGLIGKLLYNLYPNSNLKALSFIRTLTESSILDVGCGSGYDLYALREMGFHTTLGIDLFIDKDLTYSNGTTIRQGDVFSLKNDRMWDIIMFHHSFEHMEDPFSVLKAVASLLSPQGVCIIRIPVVPSYAWTHYRECWVQIDAPRHFFIHSVKSMQLLAEQSGLTVSQPIYDSTSLQFYGSEEYLLNIPLNSSRSYHVNRSSSLFSRRQLRCYDKQSRSLNRDKQGDQAIFFLTRKDSLHHTST